MVITPRQELYHFIRMQFGLWNAPSTFQQTMDVAPLVVSLKFALLYLDNIVVVSQSAADLIEVFMDVITHLRDEEAIVKLKKSKFITNTNHCLKYVTCARCSEIASHTMVAINWRKDQRSLIKLMWFRGVCNVIKRLVPTLFRIASPINSKIQNELWFNLVLKEQKHGAMKSLKRQFSTLPVLTRRVAERSKWN